MFEKEIKFIYDFSINEVRRLGSFFTYEELSSVDLHPAILKYISAELDYLIYEDRQKLLSNSNFDYSGSKIAEYFTLIGEEIKKSKRFSFEYVDNLILHAISFNVNFLAQPKWALTKLIFEKEDVVKTAELRQIINYIYFHEYLKAIIEKYLLKKNLQMISRAEFESILDKIDLELLGLDPSKVFSLVLRAIGEFFNIGSVIKSKIPLYPFKLYLKEKKFQGHVAKLESTFKGDTRQAFDIVEVQNVLFPQEVKKQPEQKSQPQKAAAQKPAEVKPAEQKKAEKKTPEKKQAEQKKTEQILPVQNKENYLDRIVKQETPASFFSFGRVKEETENNLPVEEKAANETQEAKENEIETPVNNGAETLKPEIESPKDQTPLKEEEIPVVKEEEELFSLLDDTVSDEKTDFDSLLNEDPAGTGNNAVEEESVIMEFSEEEKTLDSLEFEEVEETETAALESAPAESAPAESVSADSTEIKTGDNDEEKTEDVFEGINIDNIDLDQIDPEDEQESEVSTGSSNSGFLSRLLKKGNRSNGNRRKEESEIAEEEKEAFAPAIDFEGEIRIEEEAKDEEEIKISEEIKIEEEEAPTETVENKAAAGTLGEETAFIRIFAVISEVFSKREQQKIISELFANRPEKFAGTVYNVITEARDVYDALRLIDKVLKANKIDLNSRWAKVFKKNIQKYFNQD